VSARCCPDVGGRATESDLGVHGPGCLEGILVFLFHPKTPCGGRTLVQGQSQNCLKPLTRPRTMGSIVCSGPEAVKVSFCSLYWLCFQGRAGSTNTQVCAVITSGWCSTLMPFHIHLCFFLSFSVILLNNFCNMKDGSSYFLTTHYSYP
jgi:hypothetical protein